MEELREQMVREQIEERGITDPRVLRAIRTVERHRFIPDMHSSSAYDDHPVPIGHGQTISQPYIVALMSELCELRGNEKVLEIGTGSGYQTAVLSLLAREIYTIEVIRTHGEIARRRLLEMGYHNIMTRIGDGYRGWPEKAPFDVIILTAAPPELPPLLLDQLADGGRLVAPVGDLQQELVRIRKKEGKTEKEMVTFVRFVPMVHDEPDKNN